MINKSFCRIFIASFVCWREVRDDFLSCCDVKTLLIPSSNSNKFLFLCTAFSRNLMRFFSANGFYFFSAINTIIINNFMLRLSLSLTHFFQLQPLLPMSFRRSLEKLHGIWSSMFSRDVIDSNETGRLTVRDSFSSDVSPSFPFLPLPTLKVLGRSRDLLGLLLRYQTSNRCEAFDDIMLCASKSWTREGENG